jgi:NAD(P)-dependent dehydrogenase (short-subunit alcohol dehydrogenase family)
MASSGNKKLLGKVALITGGSRGIGRAIAAAYADQGAKVFICGRDPTEINRAVAEIRQSGGEIAGAPGDIGNATDAGRIVAAALAKFAAIDILVNNAGILGPRVAIADYPIAEWEEVLRINLNGLFFITREVLPVMLARWGGSIINLTSGVARLGTARWGAYAVSKAGLEGFTQVLADEVKASGIRVNSVNPAPTRTGMRAAAYPQEDPSTLPTPASIMAIFIFLASDISSRITGQALNARNWTNPKNS